MRTKSVSYGVLWLTLAQIMVALNIVMSKSLLTTIPVIIMMTIRFSIATAVLFPMHWLSPERNQPWFSYFTALNRKDWIFLFAQALSAGVLFNFLMLTGLHATDANVAGIMASLLTAIMPIATVIFAWIMLHEALNIHQTIGLSMVLFSIIIYARFQ